MLDHWRMHAGSLGGFMLDHWADSCWIIGWIHAGSLSSAADRVVIHVGSLVIPCWSFGGSMLDHWRRTHAGIHAGSLVGASDKVGSIQDHCQVRLRGGFAQSNSMHSVTTLSISSTFILAFLMYTQPIQRYADSVGFVDIVQFLWCTYVISERAKPPLDMAVKIHAG